MPDVRAALLLCCVLSRGASGQYIAVTPLPSTQDSDVGLLIKSMIRHSGGCRQLAGVYRALFGLCSPQNVKDFGNLKWKATAGSAAMFGTCEIPDSPCTVEVVADRMISWPGLCAGMRSSRCSRVRFRVQLHQRRLRLRRWRHAVYREGQMPTYAPGHDAPSIPARRCSDESRRLQITDAASPTAKPDTDMPPAGTAGDTAQARSGPALPVTTPSHHSRSLGPLRSHLPLTWQRKRHVACCVPRGMLHAARPRPIRDRPHARTSLPTPGSH
jgi:hypothetical protein